VAAFGYYRHLHIFGESHHLLHDASTDPESWSAMRASQEDVRHVVNAGEIDQRGGRIFSL
jgi:hypothetical protein